MPVFHPLKITDFEKRNLFVHNLPVWFSHNPDTVISEVRKMSPKELSYIEDALTHEQFLKNQCDEAMKCLNDSQLISCVQELKATHQQIFDSLYKLV